MIFVLRIENTLKMKETQLTNNTDTDTNTQSDSDFDFGPFDEFVYLNFVDEYKRSWRSATDNPKRF